MDMYETDFFEKIVESIDEDIQSTENMKSNLDSAIDAVEAGVVQCVSRSSWNDEIGAYLKKEVCDNARYQVNDWAYIYRTGLEFAIEEMKRDAAELKNAISLFENIRRQNIGAK